MFWTHRVLCKTSMLFQIHAGEWWDANVINVENEALATGAEPNISDAFTINGKPGDLYPCSQNGTYVTKKTTIHIIVSYPGLNDYDYDYMMSCRDI